MRPAFSLPRPILLSLAALLALPLPVHARELLGADAVLKRLAEPLAPDAVAAADPVVALKDRVRAFVRESAGLPPETSATRWLALYDAFVLLSPEAFYRQNYADRLDMAALIEALPPPEAWDALAAVIQVRTEKATSPRELGLRVLGTVIVGDHEARLAALQKLRDASAANKKLEDYELESIGERTKRLEDAILAASGATTRLAAFSRELEEYEKPAGSRNRYLDSSLLVPDLVRLGGREAADPLLLRALRLDVDLHIWDSDSTRRALAELALREIDRLKRPQWALVTSLDDLALYEALDKKFPDSGADRQRRAATGVYLLGLVAAGRTEEATRLIFADDTRLDLGLTSYGSHAAFDQLQRAGRGDAVVDFLREVLTRDPALPLWTSFITLSAQQSRARDALALLRSTLAKPGLPPETATGLRALYATALLAADEVDEGVAVLRALIAEDRLAGAGETAPADDDQAAPAIPTPSELAAMGVALTPDLMKALQESGAGLGGGESRDQMSERAGRVRQLLKLGLLLKRPELVEEGLFASAALSPRTGKNDLYLRANLVEASAEALLAQDRVADAETLLADHLAALRLTETGSYRFQTQDALLKLAALYGRVGRHADVLRIFTASPDLGATDLAGISVRSGSTFFVSPHLLIADALIATGRSHDARIILHRVVQDDPGCDAAYERLEKLGGEGYEAFLDQATRWDRFEERPLIWKARHQFANGRIEEAEKTIRAAIAIDPSDGEQGKGDRMRAYAVLGDILEKRGDGEQAAVMRGAVAAIRQSEQADDWWQAGLLTRAVGLYETALLKFADAYCIQSRLALRYNELGDFAKAEQHYRRAFELMPESFGRVESHCFGCEGAFRGARAQSVAERVFTELAVRMPDRPQVFYLLGYLRSEQGRPAEAADHFRKAVALDPDYLNAWDKLQGVADLIPMPAAERETIALAILRLDPAGKHAQPELEGLSDLRRLWGTLLAMEAGLPPRETGPLFEFPASRAKRDAAKNGEEPGLDALAASSEAINLRKRLSENALFTAAGEFIESTLNR